MIITSTIAFSSFTVFLDTFLIFRWAQRCRECSVLRVEETIYMDKPVYRYSKHLSQNNFNIFRNGCQLPSSDLRLLANAIRLGNPPLLQQKHCLLSKFKTLTILQPSISLKAPNSKSSFGVGCCKRTPALLK